MQQCVVRQSRTKSHLFHAQAGPRKRQTVGCALTTTIIKMPNENVRWAFNFTKWVPSHSDLLLAISCIQPEEKERLSKFVFKKDFKSSLIGRLMMRKFVSEASGLDYSCVKFLRDEKGKPFLENKDDFPLVNFNVSHQGDFTVLAGSVGRGLLGVDVVKVEYPRGKSLNEYFRIMNRTFSTEEWGQIRQGCEREQLGMFYRHWCLKESYVKAVGVGITINLQDVRFKIHTNQLKADSIVDDTEVFLKGQKLLGWSFHEMLLDDDHCVAVATDFKNEEKIRFKQLEFSDLMKNAIPLLDPDPDYCNKFFQKCDNL